MIRGVLLDLSGVVHIGDDAVPGALEAIARLNDGGLAVGYLTNTTSRPKRAILERLRRLGLAVEPETLITPAEAARVWLTRNRRAPHLLVTEALAEDFANLGNHHSGEAVVIGDAGQGFTYDALNAAFRKLAGGAELVALARNRMFRGSDGQLSLDAGAFVAALEYAAQCEAVLLGKPAPAFFEAALARLGTPAGETAMVGDDVEADVSGALAAGIGCALLVRTGKYADGAEDGADPPPTAVLADLAAAADWILASNG